MYFGLFRISEVTQSNHILKAKDVKVGRNKDKMLFILRSSKTHDAGCKSQTIKINSVEYDPLGNSVTSAEVPESCCPFKLLLNYLQLRKKCAHDSEQFFVFRDRSPVTAQHFRSILKDLLDIGGFDSKYYSSHSICTGRTGDLLELGIEFPVLAKLVHWKSGISIYTYLKPL